MSYYGIFYIAIHNVRFILIQISQNERALNEGMHQHDWWAHQQAKTGGRETLVNPVEIILSLAYFMPCTTMK